MTRAALPSVFLLVFAACGSSSEPPPDPGGTVTVTMRLGDGVCFDCSAGADLTLDDAGNLHGMIASLGPLAGIGEVTKTAAVSQVTTTAIAGNGYVVRANNAFDSYYAIYVSDYLQSTAGAELGVYLKWAPLSAVSSLAISPSSVTVAIPTTGVGTSPSISVTLSYSDGHTVDAHKSTAYSMPVCTSGASCPTLIDDPNDPTRLVVQIKPGTQPGTYNYGYQARPYAEAKATLSVTAQ